MVLRFFKCGSLSQKRMYGFIKSSLQSILKQKQARLDLLFSYSYSPSISNILFNSSGVTAFKTFSRTAVFAKSSLTNCFTPPSSPSRISWILPMVWFFLAYSANAFAFGRLSSNAGRCGSIISMTYFVSGSVLTIMKSGCASLVFPSLVYGMAIEE